MVKDEGADHHKAVFIVSQAASITYRQHPFFGSENELHVMTSQNPLASFVE